jgi:hypothetical protein
MAARHAPLNFAKLTLRLIVIDAAGALDCDFSATATELENPL